MALPPRDRLLKLAESSTLNGADFVEVSASDPLHLRVHFVNAVPVAQPGLAAHITGGDRIPEVPVSAITAAAWSTDAEGRPLLTLTIPEPGDFSVYSLTFTGGNVLDPYFRTIKFSFKAFCPSLVDCAPPPHYCPPPDDALPPIDYLAKDFLSFRKALSDFSSQRYPDWRERSEADFGMMFMETLSAQADDLSFLQDRVAGQCAIDTATEPRALQRLARLVDYEPRPATSAQVILQCTVSGGPLPAGVLVTAQGPDGQIIPFEIGTGLTDQTMYQVDPRWNEGTAPDYLDGLLPYYWDDRDRCLLAGATSMYMADHGHFFSAGQKLLIHTDGPTTADPPLRQIVELVSSVELTDPLFAQALTLIEWRPEDALAADRDLTKTRLAGNLVPATQGRRYAESFAINHAPPGQHIPLAIARLGPNSTAADPVWQFFYTLRNASLAWLASGAEGSDPKPEISVTLQGSLPERWRFTRSLLAAGESEQAYTVDPVVYRKIARNSDDTEMWEYDGGAGESVVFGVGPFAEMPNDGDVFEVRYRVTVGVAGNVASDSITTVDPAWVGLLSRVTNPFAASGGAAREAAERVRRMAPQAFRAIQFRAVRAGDYRQAAETLPWVQRAGTVFRWTGSWPTVFTTADPREAGEISRDHHVELIDLLNRRRLAGYESYAPRPRYVSFDIDILVCAEPDAFAGDVRAALQHALEPVKHPDGSIGFFHFDNFTLGTPFDRSRLEAAAQAVNGVAGVLSIRYRRRGFLANYVEMPLIVPLGTGEIFRLDNDLNRPERGSLRLIVGGGK